MNAIYVGEYLGVGKIEDPIRGSYEDASRLRCDFQFDHKDLV